MTGDNFLDDIQLRSESDRSNDLSVRLKLNSGEVCDPSDVLSEAKLDLLAFLLFVTIVEAAAAQGQAKVVVFDDVLQSVDASIRVKLMTYVLGRLKGWQIIFTVHDRLWLEQLLNICRRSGHRVLAKEIVRWDFERGPVVRAARLDPGSDLRAALDSGAPPAVVSGQAGLLLEEMCHHATVFLPTSVTRRKGDRYTLGDTWPPVLKKLRKTTAKPQAEAVDARVELRNLVGAHFNEWAKSVSREEAHSFAASALALYERLFCSDCLGWIEYAGDSASAWQCRCGHQVLEIPSESAS
jgi:hypothetical protein